MHYTRRDLHTMDVFALFLSGLGVYFMLVGLQPILGFILLALGIMLGQALRCEERLPGESSTKQADPNRLPETGRITRTGSSDAAIGLLFGALAVVLLMNAVVGCIARLHLAGGDGMTSSAQYNRQDFIVQTVTLYLALTVAFVLVGLHRLMKPRLPDFARGFRNGSYLMGGVMALLFCWTYLPSLYSIVTHQ